MAACLGGKGAGSGAGNRISGQHCPALRTACGDRAVLRAIHYFEENARTLAQRRTRCRPGSFADLCRAGAGKRTRILCAMPECLLQPPMCGIRGFRWHWR